MPVPHLQVGGKGRLEIRRKLGEDRDNVAPIRQLGEFLERGFDRDRIHVGGSLPGFGRVPSVKWSAETSANLPCHQGLMHRKVRIQQHEIRVVASLDLPETLQSQ